MDNSPTNEYFSGIHVPQYQFYIHIILKDLEFLRQMAVLQDKARPLMDNVQISTNACLKFYAFSKRKFVDIFDSFYDDRMLQQTR